MNYEPPKDVTLSDRIETCVSKDGPDYLHNDVPGGSTKDFGPGSGASIPVLSTIADEVDETGVDAKARAGSLIYNPPAGPKPGPAAV